MMHHKFFSWLLISLIVIAALVVGGFVGYVVAVQQVKIQVSDQAASINRLSTT